MFWDSCDMTIFQAAHSLKLRWRAVNNSVAMTIVTMRFCCLCNKWANSAVNGHKVVFSVSTYTAMSHQVVHKRCRD